jgi:hypothetical protein
MTENRTAEQELQDWTTEEIQRRLAEWQAQPTSPMKRNAVRYFRAELRRRGL